MALTLLNNICSLSGYSPDGFYWVVFDTETETIRRGPEGTWDPKPFGPNGARAFLMGFVDLDDACSLVAAPHDLQAELYVAHNIKFDSQHMGERLVSSEAPCWCTQIAEYILTAQQSKFAGLGELSMKYGFGPMEDVIGEHLARGVTPDRIPKGIIEPYLKLDVERTAAIFKRQWAAATVYQRRLIMVQSQASRIYGEMEMNGMPLDKAAAVARRDASLERAAGIQQWFKDFWVTTFRAQAQAIFVSSRLADSILDGFPPEQCTTPRALSAMLFGVPEMIEVAWRSPNPIGRKKIHTIHINWAPRTEITSPEGLTDLVKDGSCYSVSEEVLTKLSQPGRGTDVTRVVAKNALEMRKSHKLGTTYYQNLIEFSERYGDGLVHHTIHSTSTDTGRTSSANPNSQNQPEVVREVIKAPEGWVFLEFDFCQLELHALAHLSGCPDLTAALNRGDDIHYLTGLEAGLWKNRAGMTKDGRRAVKAGVFGLVYGGGATTLAEQAGVPVATMKKIIEGFYSRFPQVHRWAGAYYYLVAGIRVDLALDKDAGVTREQIPGPSGTVERCYIPSPTGRVYAYTQKEAPKWQQDRGVALSYSPTQTKNYPVQGFATGDIVPLAVMLVKERLREMIDLHTVRLVTTVHDSVLILVADHLGTRSAALNHINQAIKYDLPEALKSLWDISMDVTLKIDHEFKSTWAAKDKEA